MNLRPMSHALLAALALAGAACNPPSPPSLSTSAKRPPPLKQIDEGGYVITVGGGTVGGLYVVDSTSSEGTITTEFWVKGAAWPKSMPSDGLTFGTASETTCATWWNDVCSLSGGSYYTTALPLVPPVGPCPIPDAGSPRTPPLLWPGDYQVANSSGAAFAWVYVDGNLGEFWAMVHTIPAAAKSTMSTTIDFDSYSTFGGFECKKFPTLWFTPTYTQGTVSCTGAPPPGCTS
jgi:hypothetical protein